MSTKERLGDRLPAPLVEIHIASTHIGAAAEGPTEARLSAAQISALQKTLSQLVTGFEPPPIEKEEGQLTLTNLEIDIGFKLEAGGGSVIKLLFDATAQATIRAKVVWERK